jgi:hypothetical protein
MLMRMKMTFLAEFVAPSQERVIEIGFGNEIPAETPMRLEEVDMVGRVKPSYPEENRALLPYRTIGMMTTMTGFDVSEKRFIVPSASLSRGVQQCH